MNENSTAKDELKPVATSVATSAKKVATDFEEVFDRLKQAVKAKSDSHLARILGIKQSSVSSAKTREQIPPSWITKISMEYNISADWLLYGTGGMEIGEKGQGNKCDKPHVDYAFVNFSEDDAPELVMVNKVVAKLNAGTGSFLTDASVTGSYAFRYDWIKRKGQPNQMLLMDVFGDSMEPLIYDGDTVLLDQSQTDPYPGRIYAVRVDEFVVIKYVEVKPGAILLRSHNERYGEVELDPNGLRAKTLNVIGRIVWWCHEPR